MTATTTQRRERRFTTPETLATHPIIKLFDMPEIQKIIRDNGETGLRFSELQYILCRSGPMVNMVHTCSDSHKCENCLKRKKCRIKRYKGLSPVMKIVEQSYGRRSNMADDLTRLVNEGYLIRRRWGYYERGERGADRDAPFIASTRRAEILRVLKRRFGEKVHLVNSGRFVMIDDYQVDEIVATRLNSLVHDLDEELLRLTLRRGLGRLADEFGKHIAMENDLEERVRLQDYVLKHIATRLALWGLKEDDFPDEITRIRHLDLGVATELRSDIMNRIEQERGVMDEVRSILITAPRGPRISGWPGTVLMQLATEHLFEEESEGLAEPTKGVIDAMPRSVFQMHGTELSPRSMVSQFDDSTWLITDKRKTYLLEKKEGTFYVSRSRQKKRADLEWILKARAILDRDSAFEEWFIKSNLYLRVDIGKEASIVVIGATRRAKVPYKESLPT